MAVGDPVVESRDNSRLTLKIDTGTVDDEGETVYRNQHFRNIKPTASNQDLKDFALMIMTLLPPEESLEDVLRRDFVHLSE